MSITRQGIVKEYNKGDRLAKSYKDIKWTASPTILGISQRPIVANFASNEWIHTGLYMKLK